jgi:NAD+ kinase
VTRRVLLVVNTRRPLAVQTTRQLAGRLLREGMSVRALGEDQNDLGLTGAEIVEANEKAADGCELAVVIGGDGTILRAADMTRMSGTPLVGVNLGHVGFLAEAERDDLSEVAERVVHCRYTVEERMSIDVTVLLDGVTVAETWALNEASVEKASRERMLEVVVEVDGRPLSRWGCDGVVCATPTGSTAYAWSAGGPVVWPQVAALVLAPISAHALFARPLVVSPESVLAVEVQPETPRGVLWCDGQRTVPLPPGARVEVRRGRMPVRLARLHAMPFTDRLVLKFALPVRGWRGAAADRRAAQGEP